MVEISFLKHFSWVSTGTFREKYRGAGMVQWWECSPPNNVAQVRFPDPASYVGWVFVGSLLCSERFSSGFSAFPFSSKTNISKFQLDPGMHGHVLNEFLRTPKCSLACVNKLHLHFIFFLQNDNSFAKFFCWFCSTIILAVIVQLCKRYKLSNCTILSFTIISLCINNI